MKKIEIYLEDEDYKLLSHYKRKCHKTNNDVMNIVLDMLKMNKEFKSWLSTDLFTYIRSADYEWDNVGNFKDEFEKKQQYQYLKNLKEFYDSDF
ncbi:hypothetical protein [Faecalicoccus acidiformans]|uniref:Antitoxin n=1 Tax=Faecalicoccus acidiformans TaxID=915173 RepID=A0ABS2FM55_9FIRM|nr:hypothetical protein [Faecalicoccus acidiformans]MBM6831007.1 hypothetical protein [Faecalicoccus acidiformans]